MLADLKKDGLYVGIHENNLVVDISEDDMIRLFRKHKKRKHRNMKEVEFFFNAFIEKKIRKSGLLSKM